MSKDSNIEWTENTWGLVTGCEFAGEECINCYALKDSWRLSHNPIIKVSEPYRDTVIKTANGKKQWSGVIKCHPDRLKWVLKWKQPSKIFVCNMADLFHKEVPDDFIDLAFAYMAIANHHTYQVLTKRAERMYKYFTVESAQRVSRIYHQLLLDGVAGKVKQDYVKRHCMVFDIDEWWPMSNVWLGVSAGTQKAADERIPFLTETPAKVRFLSCEPLLEELDLSEFLNIDYYVPTMQTPDDSGVLYYNAIDWIIAGGESGPHSRVCHIEHLRSLTHQCQKAQVRIFIKQLGAKPLLNNAPYKISDKKGGILTEFPEDLQIRQFP
jgi:protein gp37